MEQNIKISEVIRDIVPQHFVEQNTTLMTVFAQDRVQQLLVEVSVEVLVECR